MWRGTLASFVVPRPWQGATLIQAESAGSSSGSIPTVAVALTLSKASASFWTWEPGPGQWVYLTVPALGLGTHPFSISSAPETRRCGGVGGGSYRKFSTSPATLLQSQRMRLIHASHP